MRQGLGQHADTIPLVLHTFAEAPDHVAIRLPPRPWRSADAFHVPADLWFENGSLTIATNGDYHGHVLLLRKGGATA